MLVCPRCQKEFQYQSWLDTHLARKTPCHRAPGGAAHECRDCHKAFSTASSLSRHRQQSCPVIYHEPRMVAKLLHKASQVLRDLSALGVAPAEAPAPTVVTNQYITNIIIPPFAGDGILQLTAEELLAICTTSNGFQEFSALGEHDRVDENKGGRYVSTVLIDVVRGSHGDPAARNVRMNPARADQTLVYAGGGGWLVQSFGETTSQLCTAASALMNRLCRKHFMDTLHDVAGGISSLNLLYTQNPARYHRDMRAPLTAHLTNLSNPAYLRIEGRGAGALTEDKSAGAPHADERGALVAAARRQLATR